MSTAKHQNRILGIALRFIARQYVFERVLFCTSLKSASANFPTNCIFVVLPIDALHPAPPAKGLYAEGAQSSSLERLCRINMVT
jgi:hypothetical protein